MKKFLQKIGRKLFGFESENQSLMWTTVVGGPDLTKERKNGFLDANIRAIGNALCNGRLSLKDNDGQEIVYTKKGDNPLLDLLYQPSRFLTQNQFRQIITAHYLIYGNIFILKNGRDGQGRPSELIPIPAPCVEILTDAKGYPNGYKIFLTRGQCLILPYEDVLHIYEGNAYSLYKGLPRAEACLIDSATLQASKEFNLSFFTNGASVGGVITMPKEGRPLRADEREEMLAFFNDRHVGAKKAHRTGLLQGGATYNPISVTSHKDMDFVNGQKASMQQIYSVMGVPPALLGLFEHAPQFNTKEQQRIFYETTVIPLARLITDAFNEYLLGDFYKDERYYIDYDFSKVEALRRDWNSDADALLKLAQKFPLNAVKNALELPLPDVEGGDEPPAPVLSAFTFNRGNLERKDFPVKKICQIRPSPAKIKKHKAAQIALLNSLKPFMSDVMEKHFKSQYEAVKNWNKENADKPFDYDAVFGSLNLQKNNLLALKVPVLSEVFNTGFEQAQSYIQSVSPQKDFKFISRKDLNDRVRAWAQANALLWCSSIEDTTLKELNGIVETLVAAGKPNKFINDVILQFFSREGFEPMDDIIEQSGENLRRTSVYTRIETITQTEVRNTISESELEAYKSTPFVTLKGWITTLGVSDHHIGHLEMDGQEVGVEENFKNPLTGDEAQAPGQFGVADQDINCLCATYPVVLED